MMQWRMGVFMVFSLCEGLIGQRVAVAGGLPLTFGWPSGIEAQVRVQVKGTRSVSTGGEIGWKLRASYTLQTSQRGKSLVVDRVNFSGWQGGVPKIEPEIGPALLGLMIPRLVVSSAGYVEAIENTDGVRAQYEDFVGKNGGISALDKPLLENMTSASGLKAIVIDDWNVMVGFWSKKQIEAGAGIESKSKVTLPQLGLGMVELFRKGTNQGAVKCVEQDKEPRCIKLTLRVTPNKEDMLAVIKKRLTNAPKGEEIRGLEQNTEIEVVTDPHLLLPYQVVIKLENKATYPQEVITLKNERSYFFEYQKLPL